MQHQKKFFILFLYGIIASTQALVLLHGITSKSMIRSTSKVFMSAEKENRATTRSINSRLLDEINAALPKSRILEGELKVNVERELVDLNGVQPAMALLGSVFAGGMSAAAWRLTNILAYIYLQQSEKYADSDIIVVQRLTGLMKQIIVGMGTLATGIFGVTALGMALLGGKVLLGTLSGELDPSYVEKPQDDSTDVLEQAKRLIEITEKDLKESLQKSQLESLNNENRT